MSNQANLDGEVLIVFNIPEHFGSADLRRFFSDFVEAEHFVCFHFKRRPEAKLAHFNRAELLQDQKSDDQGLKFNCCPVKVSRDHCERFIARYNETHWTDDEGVDLNFKCFVVRGSEAQHWTGLDESKPPAGLPRGNVGTATDFLLESIRSCKMPPSVIKRLKLNFHERRRRAYATVPLAYEPPKSHKSYYVPSAKTETKSTPGTSKPASDETVSVEPKKAKKRKLVPDEEVPAKDESEAESETDEEAEEWDRHRTLHDDVNARRVLAHPDDIEYQEV